MFNPVQHDWNMETKVWAKRSYVTANIVVTFGFYLGALPVKWNKALNRMEPLTSRYDLGRWIFTLLFMIGWEMAIALNFVRQLVEAEDKLALLKSDPLRSAIVALALMTVLLHVHTAWKYRQFVAFINRAAGFYEFFQSNYATKRERRGFTKEDTISGMIKIGCMGLSFIMSALLIFAYLMQCRKHVLFFILPICNSDYTIYVKIPMKILGCMAQFAFVSINGAGIILYVDLFAAVVIMGVYIIREMRNNPAGRRRTTRKLLKPKCWFHNFRCLALIVQELNDCIGELFMPLHMVAVVITSSLLVTILIRYDLGPFITTGVCSLLIGIVAYYKLLIGRGSKFCQASVDALKSVGWEMRTPYLKRMHRACSALKPRVGGIFPLKQHTVATMYETSVELTTDILLL